MTMALICREMKWTWQEYRSQPVSFIRMITVMLTAEAQESRKKRAE